MGQLLENALIMENGEEGEEKEKIKNLVVDNQKWVEEHKQHLFPEDPDQTFDYVKFHHPLGGVTSFIEREIPFNSSLEEYAKSADAVTVCCFEYLGTNYNEDIQRSIELLVEKQSVDSVANFAYMALHHSSQAVKTKMITIVQGYIDANQ